MSIDLISQVRAYAEYLDSTIPSVEASDAIGERIGDSPVQPVQQGGLRRTEPQGTQFPSASRRPLLRAAQAAVLVGVLIAGAAWLTRGNGNGDVIGHNVSDGPVLTPGTWLRIEDDEVFGGADNQVPNSVTAGGPGLVVVGWVGSHDFGDAAVWTSVDGITWSRVPHDEAVFGGTFAQNMTAVINGGPRLVAVGWDMVSFADADAAVWTSPDGLTWSRVPDDEGVFGGPSYQAMWGVTAGGPGLVAVGEDRSIDREEGDVAVWTSVDGITWSRVPHDEAVFGNGQVTAVTSADLGLVAVGSDASDGSDDAAVWTSRDGITWSRVPHDEDVFGGEGGQGMQSVTVAGSVFVAVGWDGEHAAVWNSPDGVTWSRVPHSEDVFGGAGMQGVTVGGPGFVAVGFQRAAAVWTSPDGIMWSRVPYDEQVFGEADDAAMESVTVGGPGLVAVGSEGDGAGVWVAVLEE